jgi:catechol 2,3-dioxygenase-like lactoylglutathione lyase family enzyme
MLEINGVAHIFLTVGDFPRAREFYGQLLPQLGLQPVMDADGIYYCVGGKTAIGIQAPAAGYQGDSFVQGRTGLHHLCLRARSREDIDRLHELLLSMGASIVHGPQEDGWAPGYYSVLFEDPDGIRLEVNYVPGKGLLA